MITTINEVIKIEGWEPGKMIETDIWLGANLVRHIYRVLIVGGTELYMESDKQIYVDNNPCVFEGKEKGVFKYDPKEHVAKSHTQVEALADAKQMYDIKKDKEDKEKEKRVECVKTCLDGICKALKKTYHSEKQVIYKAIGKFSENMEFVDFLHAGNWHMDDEVIDEDVEYWIRRIFRDRAFTFTDEDNEGIETYVDLRHAVSVETSCEYEGKDCVHFTMVNGTTYNVYKESDNDLYVALETLYKA